MRHERLALCVEVRERERERCKSSKGGDDDGGMWLDLLSLT